MKSQCQAVYRTTGFEKLAHWRDTNCEAPTLKDAPNTCRTRGHNYHPAYNDSIGTECQCFVQFQHQGLRYKRFDQLTTATRPSSRSNHCPAIVQRAEGEI